MKISLWGNICNNHFNFLKLLRTMSGVDARLFYHADEGFIPDNDSHDAATFSQWCHRSEEMFTKAILFPGKMIKEMENADLNQVSGRYVIPAYEAYKRKGVPYIFHPYGDDFCNLPFGSGGYFSYRNLWAPIGRYLAAKTRQAITACPAYTIKYRDRRYLNAFKKLGLDPDSPRIHKIATPLDLDLLRPAADGQKATAAFTVFMPSRLIWKLGKWDNKGSDIFLQGFARFRYAHPGQEIRLHAIRKGPNAADAVVFAKEIGIANDITWHPEMPRKDLLGHYQQADVVFDCIDHYGGAYGLVSVEGMAFGKPVFGHLTEKVRADANFPPIVDVSSPEEVARELERIFRHGWQLSAQAKQWVTENNSYAAVASAYLPLIEQLTGQRVPTHG